MSVLARGAIFLGVAAIILGVVTVGGLGFVAGRQVAPPATTPSLTSATPTPGACDPYAVAVVDHSPVIGPNEGADSVNSVLGAEDGGSADFDNAGSAPGFVTMRFSAPAEDGSGDDIWLHHEDFTSQSASGATENESFTLYGSADGQTFVALGSRTPTGPAPGLSSVFGFDIAGRLPSVQYVKVQNDTVVLEHPYEGPEIDAVERRYLGSSCPTSTPPPNSVSLPPSATPTPGVAQCADTLDNDADGRADAADPACHTDRNANNPASYDPTLPSESDAQCSDAVDNDSDGRVDAADPACHTDRNANNPASYVPTLASETDPECSDLKDNDGDNRTDGADPLCHTDFNPNNPASYNPSLDNEAETFDPGGVREID